MTFGEVFRQELAKRGLSQYEAGEQLGIRQQEISAWVTGQRLPAARRVPKVARWLRIPASELAALIDGEKNLDRRVSELEAQMKGLRDDLRRLDRALRRSR